MVFVLQLKIHEPSCRILISDTHRNIHSRHHWQLSQLSHFCCVKKILHGIENDVPLSCGNFAEAEDDDGGDGDDGDDDNGGKDE